MTTSAILAQPSEPPREGTVTGRMSSSFYNDVSMVQPVEFSKAGNAAVGAIGGRWYNEGNTPRTVVEASIEATTAPTGAALVVDVKKNGTTVYAASGDRPSVAAGANRSTKAAVTKSGDPVIVKPGEYLTVEATQVGSTVAGADVTVKVKLV